MALAWQLKDGERNESGGDPHLFNSQRDSYRDHEVGAEVSCGRIYSDQGWQHNCGISFHVWLHSGVCKIWSADGQDREDDPEGGGLVALLVNSGTPVRPR